MRSGREIWFRLRQEVMNLGLYAWPPGLSPDQVPAAPWPGLPDPGLATARVRGTAYARRLVAQAEAILLHRFELLGHAAVDLGPAFSWRRDAQSGRETALGYFRRIPYLDANQVGDQKMVWEINRHAHLVTLAQAWRLTADRRYIDKLVEHLEDWWRANSFQQGINWTAALEVAFRALSWLWVYHLAGDALPPAFRRRLAVELYRHGCHLEVNLSVYSSPNTHLLGEAVALHAIAALWPALPGAPRWRRAASSIVASHLRTHVLEDGMYFEQSTYYHIYALDMFLFHALLEPVPDEYRQRLRRMAEFTVDLMGPGRQLPFFGDDDGGRLFHPYGPRAQFGRGTLAAAGRWLGMDVGAAPEDDHELADWWLGDLRAPVRGQYAPASRHHGASGLVTLRAGQTQAIVDAGPLGAGTAGHSHADTLSLVVREDEQTLLLDPGTYRYGGDPAGREWFRSTEAHNTIRLDGLNQADAVHLFRWTNLPQVEVVEWVTQEEFDWLHACCRYRGLTHRRRVAFLKSQRLIVVLDQAAGEGEHLVEQFWHAGPEAAPEPRSLRIGSARLLSTAPADAIDFRPGWQSPAFGVKREGRIMRVSQRGELPLVLGAVLDLDGHNTGVEIDSVPQGWRLHLRKWQIDLPSSPGVPRCELRKE